MALQTVQVSFEPRFSTATHKADTELKDIAQLCSGPTVSARLRYHVSNSNVFVHSPGTQKDKRYPSCSQRQNCCHLKKENTSTWSVLLA